MLFIFFLVPVGSCVQQWALLSIVHVHYMNRLVFGNIGATNVTCIDRFPAVSIVTKKLITYLRVDSSELMHA